MTETDKDRLQRGRELREIRRRFPSSGSPCERCKREKEEIVTEYLGHLANHILYMGCNELWKNTEAAANEIQKDPALYNNPKVRALMEAIYGKACRKEFT